MIYDFTLKLSVAFGIILFIKIFINSVQSNKLANYKFRKLGQVIHCEKCQSKILSGQSEVCVTCNTQVKSSPDAPLPDINVRIEDIPYKRHSSEKYLPHIILGTFITIIIIITILIF